MKCVIIVPIYKNALNGNEVISLLRLKELFQKNVYFIGPADLLLDGYLKYWPDMKYISFQNNFFENISSYNKFMLSQDLYRYFSPNFKWVLIHQLDAFLFHNDLNFFMKLDYDYYGAPWINGQFSSPYFSNRYLRRLFGKKVFVGNGGLSLRKIESTLQLIKKNQQIVKNWKINEDAFFAYFGAKMISKDFKTCPLKIACLFASEKKPEIIYNLNNKSLPFGCHGFEKYDTAFYKNIFSDLGYKINI